ncbi:MAG: hypothetical protein FWH27_05825 [Planctomycetaceae bacterium]|nr:hypothetical protein [Planctomycetaceae bacterium]
MTFPTKHLIWLLFLLACTVHRGFGQPVSVVDPLGMIDERFGTFTYLDPCDILLDADGNFLFVLNAGSRDLRKISLIDERPPQIFQFNIEPVRMTRTPDGKHIAIVGGGMWGKLLLVDAEMLRLEKIIAVGHTPSDVTVFQSGGAMTAYVANRFSGDISVVDLAAGQETARWEAGREPIALDLTPDGTRLVTVSHLPEDSMQYLNPRCRVRIFDTATGDAMVVPLFHGSMNARDLVISPDGRYAFTSCLLAHFEQVPSMVDNGWINENVLAVVDLETNAFADMVYLDESGHGAANPWGLAVSDDNRYLAVAHTGSCEVSLLNLPRIIQRLDNRPHRNAQGYGQYPHSGRNDAGSTMPPCVRIPLGMKGMRRLVMDVQGDGGQGRVFCTAAYEDVIGRFDFKISDPVMRSYDYNTDPDGPPKPKHVSPLQKIVDYANGEVAFELLDELPYQSDNLPKAAAPARLTFERLEPLVSHEGFAVERSLARLGPPVIWDIIRRGEVLFHDGVYCRQQWQSCASCHPDARADGVNWDLLNDGNNNPKNTKSMLYSHETPPAMATGVRADAETAVRAGVHSILFVYLSSENDYCAMDEYLKSLRPVPSPFLVDGQLSDSAKRGKLLFNDARTGCSVCHPESNYYTDLKLHDVGTQGYDYYKAYDTPTLIEVWRTAPYLHDGRYETIRELIVEGKHFAPDDRLDLLTEQEIDDLVTFVLSL